MLPAVSFSNCAADLIYIGYSTGIYISASNVRMESSIMLVLLLVVLRDWYGELAE